MTVTVNAWAGGLGSNVLQVARALLVAEKYGHGAVLLPAHDRIALRRIGVHGPATVRPEAPDLADRFENVLIYEVDDTIAHMRRAIQAYARDLLPLPSPPARDRPAWVVHMRGGAVMDPARTSNRHVQVPLYVMTVIADSARQRGLDVVVVADDDANHVVRACRDRPDVTMRVGHDELEDLALIGSARTLTFGYSAFPLAALLLARDPPESVVLPDLRGLWWFERNDVGFWGVGSVSRLLVPGYVRIGEWRADEDQQRFMTRYAPPSMPR